MKLFMHSRIDGMGKPLNARPKSSCNGGHALKLPFALIFAAYAVLVVDVSCCQAGPQP